MLLQKRDSAFVSTEDENLWIPSRLMWFDEEEPPKRSLQFPPNTMTNKKQNTVWRELHPNFQILFLIVHFHFKGDMI